MQEEILFEIPHVRLTQSANGICCLVVEDTGLNDFVEDILWDHYQYDSITVDQPSRTAPVTYFNYFGAGVPVKELLEALRQIDVKEVERIFNLPGY